MDLNKKIAIIENTKYFLFDTVICFDLSGDGHKGLLLNFNTSSFKSIRIIKNNGKVCEFITWGLKPTRMVLFEKCNPIFYYKYKWH